MDTSDSLHSDHSKRLKNIWVDAFWAFVGICTSLLSIYWTVTHGLPFKTYAFDGVARTLVILTSVIYIFAQSIAIGTCILRSKLSTSTLTRDLKLQLRTRPHDKSLQD